ncbi:MAG: Smr/MutS family protein [Treponema sp.]|jgi:DNA-nicking Smr family endonuclease|nr:Smr/MutS family protein [Treponema sp.]
MGVNANFGDILDKWISANGIQNKDEEAADKKNAPSLKSSAQEKRRRLHNKKPDAELDIHGQTREEAWQTLDAFFRDAEEKEHEKVLIIHGKGNHSAGDSVLKRVVMDFIEQCPCAGESGRGKAATGGEGVTWVLLKASKREVS